jgi:hypothetical protein
MQVGQVADIIGLVGADRTPLIPGRVEHEVLHDELSPALEEIHQAGPARRAVEYVVLLDLHGRQLTAPARDLLESAYGLLLVGLQLLARGHPLVGRHDSRNAHCSPPSLRRCPCATIESLDEQGMWN